jgi:hypothetical protein
MFLSTFPRKYTDLQVRTNNSWTLRSNGHSVHVRTHPPQFVLLFPWHLWRSLYCIFFQTTIIQDFDHVSALCICLLAVTNYTVYSISRSMFYQIIATRIENRKIMWDLRHSWRWLWRLLTPKYSKRAVRNILGWDINYCLRNMTSVAIIFDDITILKCGPV